VLNENGNRKRGHRLSARNTFIFGGSERFKELRGFCGKRGEKLPAASNAKLVRAEEGLNWEGRKKGTSILKAPNAGVSKQQTGGSTTTKEETG